jgi:hypothetical protein
MKTHLRNLEIAATLLLLTSCGDPDGRELAGGYRMKRSGSGNQFALIAPYENGGLIIEEIGWQRPLIIARSAGSDDWNVINTDRAQHVWISDAQRKGNEQYRSIPTEPAEKAWNNLSGNGRLW